MNFRMTAILVIVAALVVGGVYFSENQRKSSNATPTPGPNAPVDVLGLKTADVTRLKIVDKAGKTVEVVKDGENWKMTAPTQEPADATRVELVVRQIGEGRANRKIEAKDVDLAAFELQQPAYTMTLTTAAGEKTLKVGGQTADKTAFYTQQADDPAVYLMSNLNINAATGLIERPPVQPTPTPGVTVLPAEATRTPTVTPAATETPRP